MSDIDEDKAKLKTIFEEELPGFVRSNDVDGYMSLWAHDCTWCPPDRPDEQGKAAIRDAVTKLLEEASIDPTFKAEDIWIAGTLGFVNGTSKEFVTPKIGGPTTVVYTREFWLFVNEGGDWKITRLIFNHKPGPPQ